MSGEARQWTDMRPKPKRKHNSLYSFGSCEIQLEEKVSDGQEDQNEKSPVKEEGKQSLLCVSLFIFVFGYGERKGWEGLDRQHWERDVGMG